MNNNYSSPSATGIRGSNSASSCTPQQQHRFEPYMLGGSRGFGVDSCTWKEPEPLIPGHVQKSCPPAVRTFALRNYNRVNTSVRDCMQWPASLKASSFGQQQQPSGISSYSSSLRNPHAAPAVTAAGGDFQPQYCSAPPKVYMSTPGHREELVQQNIPCQIAPLGTDPMSMIRPLEPLTVRVQAPADLFAGNPSQPRTISIPPSVLYGNNGGR